MGDLVPLTDKQEAFCIKYMETRDQEAAYRHAYDTSRMKAAVVRAKASELIRKDRVRDRLEQLQEKVRAKVEEDLGVTVSRIAAEWATAAFYDPKDYFDFGMRKRTKYTKDGESYEVVEPFLTYKNLADMTEAQRRAISVAEMTISKTGDPVVSIKMISKEKALTELGKHLGFYEVDNAQKKDVPSDGAEIADKLIEHLNAIADDRAAEGHKRKA